MGDDPRDRLGQDNRQIQRDGDRITPVARRGVDMAVVARAVVMAMMMVVVIVILRAMFVMIVIVMIVIVMIVIVVIVRPRDHADSSLPFHRPQEG